MKMSFKPLIPYTGQCSAPIESRVIVIFSSSIFTTAYANSVKEGT